jgi:hypothetical protein
MDTIRQRIFLAKYAAEVSFMSRMLFSTETPPFRLISVASIALLFVALGCLPTPHTKKEAPVVGAGSTTGVLPPRPDKKVNQVDRWTAARHKSGAYGLILSDSLLVLGAPDSGEIVISPNIRRTQNATNLLKWVITISVSPQDQAKVVKLYTGGGLPPSSIAWQGQDSQGGFVPSGIYYVRMSTIDSNDEVHTTEWTKVQVKRLH